VLSDSEGVALGIESPAKGGIDKIKVKIKGGERGLPAM